MTGSEKAWFMLSRRSQARLYDIPMSRAAAEIEPVSRMLSSSIALPGPMRAPDSKTMLTLIFGMTALSHRKADLETARNQLTLVRAAGVRPPARPVRGGGITA